MRSLSAQNHFKCSEQKPLSRASGPSQSSQTTLNFGFSKEHHDHICRLYARAILESEMPLSAFDHPAWKALLRDINPAWKPPTRREMQEIWLPAVHEEIKAKVDPIIDANKQLTVTLQLTVTTDEFH
ncbi:uncharacterized protein Z520_03460 [Fonsecaea multimorphosa CBS 102226]|uniref:Uncharacterized protein n=1 Tax=Fonsecaea multimorphosa CBS 102226 TaxID=1442371 RepID=A0A0D2KVL2_9EURO|nr:uncharacterized protein Z520_03460 [Fonsecaea multimorphosa CBS 102226]KIY00794.1 hypothetical protein Z520_03460 [Fonsecaea multimorphosa CBS 102226]OAL27893.1 hypothetical protein AYO22_03238 [Fonsecaea multimorphosa]